MNRILSHFTLLLSLLALGACQSVDPAAAIEADAPGTATVRIVSHERVAATGDVRLTFTVDNRTERPLELDRRSERFRGLDGVTAPGEVEVVQSGARRTFVMTVDGEGAAPIAWRSR